jgi:hypothetical protein
MAPALGGTLGSSWVSLTVAALVGPTEPLLGDRFWNWVVMMLVGTPLALALGVALLGADLVLLRGRPLPVGPRAWAMGVVAPWLLALVYTLHAPARHGQALGYLLALALPIVLVAFVVRLALGARG